MNLGQPITIPEGFKANDLSDEQVKAFLDDLARISLRHGVMIANQDIKLETLVDCVDGYSFDPDLDEAFFIRYPEDNNIVSIDITQLSAHERIQIHGKQSPDADGDFYAISREEALAAKANLEGSQKFSRENLVGVEPKSPDLEQLIQDAFMAGVEATGEGWNGEHPMTKDSSEDFHGQAYDYASATVREMGGQG